MKRSIEFPSILLGCSPFYGPSQFEKAKEYREKFSSLENIFEVIKETVGLGIKGVQIIAPNAIGFISTLKGIAHPPPLIEAIKKVEKELGERLPMVTTIYDEKSIELVADFDNRVMLTEGIITDKLDVERLLDLSDTVRDKGAAFGIATHDVGKVLPRLSKRKEFWRRVEVVMCPVNSIGFKMKPSKEEALGIIADCDKVVIAMKTLASGRIPLEEIDYVGRLPYVKALAIGVASVNEVRETFVTVQRLWKKPSSVLIPNST
jgi:hypothetical protein